MKLNQKLGLAEKITDILNTAPIYSDPEAQEDCETSTKFSQDIHTDDGIEEEILSKFRKQNIDLLSDIDQRYAGKGASRKFLQESDESNKSESPDDNSVSESELSEGISEAENTCDEVDEDGETDEHVADKQEDSHTSGEEYVDDDNFQHVKDTNIRAQLNKGLCVRNQINIFENLLEIRIQLQNSLLAANKMPPYDRYNEVKREMGQEFSEKLSEVKANVGNLLDMLLVLQNLVQKKYPESRKLRKTDILQDNIEDEEIASDMDEDEILEEHTESDDNIPVKRRKNLSEYEKDISENFALYKPYRNSVIQKWHEKTRLILVKNNTPSQSIVQHIEHTLGDKTKLWKRTQLKRSEYKILGESDEKCNVEDDGNSSRLSQIYNTEIFDDDDFYHQLLRELIELKSAHMTDSVRLGRQWIQLQNLRSKMKRKIDTRATKGRKVRYTVHTKLVNFMAPIDENSWSDEAKTKLYGSLFGKN